MKFKFAIIIILTYLLIGCNKSVIEPTAAEAISGTYEAKTYQAFDDELTYPINSQTIRIQIDAVSKDTVKVQVNSSINGFYSPGDTAIYPKVFVKETVGSNLQYRKSYQIFLAPPINNGTAENSISFEPDYDNKASYIYSPPGYTLGAVETILVRIK